MVLLSVALLLFRKLPTGSGRIGAGFAFKFESHFTKFGFEFLIEPLICRKVVASGIYYPEFQFTVKIVVLP